MLNTSRLALALSTLVFLSACGTSLHRAPVENRDLSGKPSSAATKTPNATPEAKPLPGAENAGKPGYYTVKPGDALIRIALDHGQPWRDVAKWNGLDDPNRIEVGQVLRVAPPAVDAQAVTTRPVASAPKSEVRSLDAKPAPSTSPASPSVTGSHAASAPTPAASNAVSTEETLPWGWPVSNAVTAGFDEQRNKGLDFAGKPGDPVYAVAEGRVVYVGAGLRGYGNLVIIKHNNTYLTAYAHNRVLLVEQDQVVRKGQKIAEMGDTESETVKLHFEVRKQGKPVDPAKLLPAR